MVSSSHQLALTSWKHVLSPCFVQAHTGLFGISLKDYKCLVLKVIDAKFYHEISHTNFTQPGMAWNWNLNPSPDTTSICDGNYSSFSPQKGCSVPTFICEIHICMFFSKDNISVTMRHKIDTGRSLKYKPPIERLMASDQERVSPPPAGWSLVPRWPHRKHWWKT